MYLHYNVITDEITSRCMEPQDLADLVSGCKAIVAVNTDGARGSTLQRVVTMLEDLAICMGLALTIIGEPHLYLGFEFNSLQPLACAECNAVTLNDCLHM